MACRPHRCYNENAGGTLTQRAAAADAVSMSEPGDFIYLHPYGNPGEADVPVGAVGAINASGAPFRGFYSWELPAGAISRCRLVAIDLHWFHCLPAFIAQTIEIKRLNPSVRIVAGGITAALTANFIFSRTPVDFILTGHTEAVFGALVRAVGENLSPDGIPGLLTRRAAAPDTGATRAGATLDSLDAATLDWFPTLREFTLRKHEAVSRAAPGGVDFDHYYPFVPTVRGCETGCGGCYGSYGGVIFPGAPLVRAPRSIREAVARIEANPEYRLFSFLGDFLARMSVESVREALPERSRLWCAFHSCDVPDHEKLAAMLAVFPFVHFHINLRRHVFKPGAPGFDAEWRRLTDFLDAFGRMPNLKISLYALTKAVYDAAKPLVRAFPGLESRDDREWYLRKPDERNFRERRGFRRSEELLARAVDFQNSAATLRLMEGTANEYPAPADFPSDKPERLFMPGLSRPAFTLRAAGGAPDVKPGEIRLLPPWTIDNTGPVCRFDTVFALDGKYIAAEMPVSAAADGLLSIDYTPPPGARDVYRGRVKRRPVFRIDPVDAAEPDAGLIARVSCPPAPVRVEVKLGDKILFAAETEKLFEVLPPGPPLAGWTQKLLAALDDDAMERGYFSAGGFVYSFYEMENDGLRVTALSEDLMREVVIKVAPFRKSEPMFTRSAKFRLVHGAKTPEEEAFAREAAGALAELLRSKGL